MAVNPRSLVLYGAFLFAAISISLSPLVRLDDGLSWYDQQRVAQLIVYFLGLIFINFAGVAPRHICRVSLSVLWICVFLINLGVFSVLGAKYVEWALVEFSLQYLGVVFAFSIAVVRYQYKEYFDNILLSIIFLVNFLIFFKFLVAYVAFIANGLVLNPWMMIDGFSNLRFYGQFLTLTWPIIVGNILSRRDIGEQWVGWFIFASLLVFMAIFSGTRGTWIAIACSVMLMIFFGSCGRRWIIYGFLSVVVGLLFYLLFANYIPGVLRLGVQNSAIARVGYSLSGREDLWRDAIVLILNHPLLGAGPMHFASEHHAGGAHPHQFLLQWFSEWGFVSGCLVLFLLSKFMVFMFKLFQGGELCNPILGASLFSSVFGGLVQSMVDGVFVVPYTATWFFLIVGWLLGLVGGELVELSAKFRWYVTGTGAFLIFFVIYYSMFASDIINTECNRGAGDEVVVCRPRYWMQGFIY